jgi:hypothetical protein
MSNLLQDFLDLDPFAKEIGRHPRTVRRWFDEPDGLPHTRIGNRILIHVPTARDWLFSRMRGVRARRTEKAGQPSITSLKRRPAQTRIEI